MKKLEFLTKLRNCLEKGGMNSDDINDALTYYEEVFLDAGFGKEEETAASMGSPEDVAVNILRESGIQISGPEAFDPQPTPSFAAGPMPGPMPQYQYPYQGAPVQQKSADWKLRIFLAVITFPLWLPLLIVVVSVLFALIVTVISIVVAFVVSGIALIAGGFVALFEVPSIGLMLLGAGLFITGIVLLLFRPVLNSAVPAMGRGIKSACSWIGGLFKKGGKVNG